MGFNVSKDLTVDNILEQIAEYDIFKTYCMPFKSLDTFFKSELREDNKPTCKVFVNEQGNLIYHDFNGSSHNCFTYIKEKYGTDFNTVLNIVNRDFKLGLRYSWSSEQSLQTHVTPQTYKGKKRSGAKVTVLKKRKRNWSIEDKKYWLNKYNIHKSTLEFFRVEPIDYYWINDYRFSCKTITYSYEFDDGCRDIYSPLSETYRWGASTTRAEKHIYGLQQLPATGDILFITSSLKEVMFLYELDINAIAPQSETTFIPNDIIEDLKSRFTTIIIMYDFDRAGCINAMKQSAVYNIPYMKFCPVMVNEYNAKDLTDGYEQDNNKILNLINDYEKYI
jgi:hypothetical protein